MFSKVWRRLVGKRLVGPTSPIEIVKAAGAVDDACAVLTMIARCHGRDVDPATVEALLAAEATPPDIEPRTALDIVNAAAQLGLLVRGMALTRPSLFAQLPYPCIGHQVARGYDGVANPSGTFVVLESLAGQLLTVIDPFHGQLTTHIENFFHRPETVILVVEPVKEIPRAVLVRRA